MLIAKQQLFSRDTTEPPNYNNTPYLQKIKNNQQGAYTFLVCFISNLILHCTDYIWFKS